MGRRSEVRDQRDSREENATATFSSSSVVGSCFPLPPSVPPSLPSLPLAPRSPVLRETPLLLLLTHSLRPASPAGEVHRCRRRSSIPRSEQVGEQRRPRSPVRSPGTKTQSSLTRGNNEEKGKGNQDSLSLLSSLTLLAIPHSLKPLSPSNERSRQAAVTSLSILVGMRERCSTRESLFPPLFLRSFPLSLSLSLASFSPFLLLPRFLPSLVCPASVACPPGV